MKTRDLLALVSAFACARAAVGAPLTFPDAEGDIFFPEYDVRQLRTEVVGDVLHVTVEYAATVRLVEMNFGTVFIDADRNPDTGVQLGADCIVDYAAPTRKWCSGLGFLCTAYEFLSWTQARDSAIQ